MMSTKTAADRWRARMAEGLAKRDAEIRKELAEPDYEEWLAAKVKECTAAAPGQHSRR